MAKRRNVKRQTKKNKRRRPRKTMKMYRGGEEKPEDLDNSNVAPL